MVPGAREALEVGGVVARAARIVPEAHRLRGEGRRRHQLAERALRRRARVVEASTFIPSASACSSPRYTGPANAGGKAGVDLRAAGDRREANVGLHLRVHPVEELG